jgi:mono/diheme cytochrome c family protein
MEGRPTPGDFRGKVRSRRMFSIEADLGGRGIALAVSPPMRHSLRDSSLRVSTFAAALVAVLAGCGSNGSGGTGDEQGNDDVAKPVDPGSPVVGSPVSGGSTGSGSDGKTPGSTPPPSSKGGSSGQTPPATPWTGGAPKGSVPITGGTLLVASDGMTAVASDPDRDHLSNIDLPSAKVLAQLQLPAGAEPGRLVEDGSGQVHAILRRGGGIADIDLFGHTLLGLRQTCALPRGIAYRASDSTLLVSCMTGALVTMDTDASNAAPLSHVLVHNASGPVTDLRDVLVVGDSIFLTTFRSPSLIAVDDSGNVQGQPVVPNTRVDPSAAALAAAGLPGGIDQSFVPEVIWRAVLGPAGDIILVHEAGTNRVINVSTSTDGATQTPVSTSCTSSEYGGETCTTTTGAPICTPPIMIGEVTSVSQEGIPSDGPALPEGALPVDLVPTPNGQSYVIALAGNPSGTNSASGTPLLNVITVPAVSQTAGPAGNAATFDQDLCGLAFATSGVTVEGQVTAVALDGQGQIVAQTREPATLQYLTAAGTVAIPLSSTSVANEGFDLFHTNTGRGMTCAGCHAEGQDDGRTWLFTDGFNADGTPVATEPRRTQTFRAGFLETAPFHWDGEFADLTALMSDVFVHRMSAPTVPTAAQQTALENWMNGIPARMHDVPSEEQATQIAAGKALFMDSTVGCASCHSGPNFTNNQNADIGFGYALQVPTLIDVSFRAPYLHDGSAATLADRFTDATAMSGKHGQTSQLSQAQIGDLIAYLESL